MSSRAECRGLLIWRVIGMSSLFVGQGLSLCLFYNYAYYGKVWLPLLNPQAFLCPLFYYLCMSQWMPALGQAILWHIGAVVCGWCWLLCLSRGQEHWKAVAMSCLLMALPGLPLAYYHALTPQGLSGEQFVRAALVRNFAMEPPTGLVYLYHALALAALLLEFSALSRIWGRKLSARRMAVALAISFVLVNLLASLLGVVVHHIWN